MWTELHDEYDADLTENFIALRTFIDHAREHSLGAIIQYT
jgi:hypothetical protein